MTWTTGELITVVFNDVNSEENLVFFKGSRHDTESDRNTRISYITDMNSIYDGSYMGHIVISFNTIERRCGCMTGTTGELTTVVFNDVKSQEIPVRPCGSRHDTDSD